MKDNSQSNDSLKDVLPIFINNLKDKKRSPSTILAYRADLEQLISFLQSKNKYLAKEISGKDLESFKEFLLLEKYTSKSVSRKLNAIKTFFRFLKEKSILLIDPSKDVIHPKIESQSPKFLNPLQYRALRDVARSDSRISAIIEIILQTGIRISEIANLKLQDVSENTLLIEAYATQKERKIEINKPAKDALENYLKNRPNTDSPFIFVSKNGKALAIRNIRASVDRYIQKAEIGKFSVNDLRTTCIIENLKRGVDLVTISQVVGHKRLSTTERYLELASITEPGKKQKLEEL